MYNTAMPTLCKRVVESCDPLMVFRCDRRGAVGRWMMWYMKLEMHALGVKVGTYRAPVVSVVLVVSAGWRLVTARGNATTRRAAMAMRAMECRIGREK